QRHPLPLWERVASAAGASRVRGFVSIDADPSPGPSLRSGPPSPTRGFAQEVSPHPVSPLACARGSPTLPLQGRVVTARSEQACKRARDGAGNPASGRQAPLPTPGGGGSPPSEREAAGWGEFLCKAPTRGEGGGVRGEYFDSRPAIRSGNHYGTYAAPHGISRLSDGNRGRRGAVRHSAAAGATASPAPLS